jgi:hypothetical protein
VQSNGKPSVYVETGYLVESPQGSRQSPQDCPEYGCRRNTIIVISLVVDALIKTYYENSQVTRLSSKQKDGVAQAANAAIQAWRG